MSSNVADSYSNSLKKLYKKNIFFILKKVENGIQLLTCSRSLSVELTPDNLRLEVINMQRDGEQREI
jgi:hypothetical protein